MASKIALHQYSTEEAQPLLDGEKLVAPEQLLDRWQITPAELRRMWRGEADVKLTPIRFGQRTVRFRLRDVLQVEYELYGRGSPRRGGRA